MIQATSGTSEISPDATSPPPKKDEPVQMPNFGRGPNRGAARRGGLRPRVLPRPKPPARRGGLRAHVARGGPGDAAAAARRRRAGGASAGAPDSSRGLVITWVSYPDVASMAHDLGINGNYHIPRAGEKTTSALARLGSVITRHRARGRGSPLPKTRGPATS